MKATSDKAYVSGTAAVREGYAALMGRFALPLFLTQTFRRGHKAERLAPRTVAALIGGSRYRQAGTHPEAVAKAHRHTISLLNDELHGNNWRRRGIVGAQSLLGIERHKSGDPHSHAVIGHPDIDLGAPEFSALRRELRLTCEAEWGFAKLEVAKSPEHCNAYVAKYVVKDGEIVISDHLEELATGQLSLLHPGKLLPDTSRPDTRDTQRPRIAAASIASAARAPLWDTAPGCA